MLNRLRLDRFLGSEAAPHNDNRPTGRTVNAIRAPGGWLGVSMQRITPSLAHAMGLEGTEGVLIADIVPESPAANAGLAIGDIIIRFGGRKLSSLSDLAAALADVPAGRSVELDLLRAARTHRVIVTVGQAVRGENTVAHDSAFCENRNLGLILGGLSNVTGVQVIDLAPDGAAAVSGVRIGDIVLRADDVPIHDPVDAMNAVRRAETAGRKAVALLINRAGGNRFIGVPLGTSGVG